MKNLLKRGFTLIEVNLAIFIMAGGILAMISLYSLGHRENRQSREDVAATACADDVINRLVYALSSTNITWKTWKKLPYVLEGECNNGAVAWRDYIQTDVKDEDGNYTWRMKANPYPTAQRVFNDIWGKISSDVGKDNNAPNISCPSKPGTGSGKLTFALVAFRDGPESPVMSISMRVARDLRWRSLMSQPIFFTEVHFQGGMREEENR